MKCSNCDRESKWLLVDSIPYDLLFEPLCEQHFQEIRGMEGEMNLDFHLIANITVDDVIGIANEKWKYMKKKYSNLLKLHSALKEKGTD